MKIVRLVSKALTDNGTRLNQFRNDFVSDLIIPAKARVRMLNCTIPFETEVVTIPADSKFIVRSGNTNYIVYPVAGSYNSPIAFIEANFPDILQIAFSPDGLEWQANYEDKVLHLLYDQCDRSELNDILQNKGYFSTNKMLVQPDDLVLDISKIKVSTDQASLTVNPYAIKGNGNFWAGIGRSPDNGNGKAGNVGNGVLSGMYLSLDTKAVNSIGDATNVVFCIYADSDGKYFYRSEGGTAVEITDLPVARPYARNDDVLTIDFDMKAGDVTFTIIDTDDGPISETTVSITRSSVNQDLYVGYSLGVRPDGTGSGSGQIVIDECKLQLSPFNNSYPVTKSTIAIDINFSDDLVLRKIFGFGSSYYHLVNTSGPAVAKASNQMVSYNVFPSILVILDNLPIIGYDGGNETTREEGIEKRIVSVIPAVYTNELITGYEVLTEQWVDLGNLEPINLRNIEWHYEMNDGARLAVNETVLTLGFD